MSELSDLLREREIRGLRGALVARLIVMLLLVGLVFLIFGSAFELVVSVLACSVAAALAALLVRLLDLGWAPEPIGIGAVGFDVTFLIASPIIWLLSVGGPEEMPMSFMLKGGISILMIMAIVLNAIALRPLYPALATTGALLAYFGLTVAALSDPRTQLTRDYAEALMGPSLGIGLIISNALFILLVGLSVCLITVRARRLTVDGVKLEKVSSQLGRYFSPAVRDKISDADADFLEPGGEEKAITILFCDIRDFTRLSERMPPHDVMQLLSDYHSRMVEAVFAHGGTLDKFIGDAVMATFGTPDPRADDAQRAVDAAITMRLALAEFNSERHAKNLAQIKHGIGIHAGSAVVGNVGTRERLEYTVIGDAVNVASRVASACKTTGEDILISGAVKEQLASPPALRDVEPITFQGKSEPVQLFAVE